MRRLLLALSLALALPAQAQFSLVPVLGRPSIPTPSGDDTGFGDALLVLPDLTADGVPELAIGHPGYDSGSGAVEIRNGRTQALIRRLAAPRAAETERFGAWLALHDTGTDGRPELLVGAPGSDPAGRSGAGRVYTMGYTGTVFFELASPTTETEVGFGGRFFSVADLSGDGVNEIAAVEIAGTPAGVGNGYKSGLVHLYDGRTGAYRSTLRSPLPDDSGILYDSGGYFGYVVRGVPDVTGDGRGDLLVAAPGEEDGEDGFSKVSDGRVWLVDGQNGAVVRRYESPARDASGNAGFGDGLAVLPDVNGDGHFDFATGAPFADVGTGLYDGNHGFVFVMDGRTGAALRRIAAPEATDDAEFGTALEPTLDLSKDGQPELLVRNDPVSDQNTATYVIDPTNGRVLYSFETPYFPWDIREHVVAPDLDGDGHAELFTALDRGSFGEGQLVYGLNLDPRRLDVEVNDTEQQAQRLFALPGTRRAEIYGLVGGFDQRLSEGDYFGVCDNDDCSEADYAEDVFVVTTTEPGLVVSLSGFNDDAELYVFRGGETPEVLGASRKGGTTPERIDLPSLPPGTYYVGVSMYGEFGDTNNAADWSPYALVVEGAIAGSPTGVARDDEALADAGLRVTLGPVPARDRLRVRVDGTPGEALSGPLSVRVVDLLGREVARLHDGPLAPGAAFDVATDGWANGTYLLVVEGGGRRLARRFVVAR